VLTQRVLLLVPQKSGLIALSGSTAYAIGSDGSVKELGSLATNFKAVSAARSSDSVWIYATGRDGLVYLSEDSGLHWRSITPDLHQCSGKFEAIATSDLNSNIAYVGFRGLRLGDGKENLFNGIAKSTDAGRSWKIVFKESIRRAVNLTGTWIESRAAEGDSSIWFDAPYSLSVAPTDSNIVYASDLFRTYRTLDGGATWLEVNSKSVGEAWTSRGLDVTSSYGVQFDPFDSRHIYMDNTDIGLFQSADGGRSWQSTTEGVPDAWRNTTYWVALDPAQRGLVWGAFSGTHDLPRPRIWRHSSVDSFMGGVGVSTDGGRHWQPSNAGLPSSPITHILLDPSIAHFMRVRLGTVFTNPLTMAKAGRRRTAASSVRSHWHGASHRLRTAHCISSWHGAVRGRLSHHLMREPSTARSIKRSPGSGWSFRRA
jgi:hypothetical protein